ncbi:MAG: hypothetical protein HZC37_04960 [Burkholderiales bacterium]|nr:hypothetical protein [Burkholderiales bacterium]
MRTQTLTDVTLKTLHNYQTAATQAVAAYHAGGQRLVGLVNGTLQARLYPQTARFAPRATERMNALRGNVSGSVVKGMDQAAERTSQAIERGAEAAAAGLTKVAGLATELGNPYVAGGLDAAARLSLPAAKLALAVSGKVAEGATTLATAAGAHPVKKAARKVATAAKRAHKSVKAAVPKARKTARAAA